MEFRRTSSQPRPAQSLTWKCSCTITLGYVGMSGQLNPQSGSRQVSLQSALVGSKSQMEGLQHFPALKSLALMHQVGAGAVGAWVMALTSHSRGAKWRCMAPAGHAFWNSQ